MRYKNTIKYITNTTRNTTKILYKNLKFKCLENEMLIKLQLYMLLLPTNITLLHCTVSINYCT